MTRLKTNLPVLLLTVVFIIFTITGCSFQGKSQEEYNDLQEKYNDLIEQNQQLQSELVPYQETINTKITGSFVATVHQLSPDYVGDSVTPRVAVLTCFQDSPFMVHVGEEMASKLKAGESYYFEIEEKSIGEISKAEFYKGCPCVEEAYAAYYFRIKSFRTPKEGEGGLDSTHIIYKKLDN